MSQSSSKRSWSFSPVCLFVSSLALELLSITASQPALLRGNSGGKEVHGSCLAWDRHFWQHAPSKRAAWLSPSTRQESIFHNLPAEAGDESSECPAGSGRGLR
ncbi:hypothetical protein F5887DRAFT_1115407 [Amanita rubescens]|nr:hypothetical protein F5887DRAFT_1115407 [Amanita rubescens]